MDFPAHPDNLTADWLTDTLRATGVLRQASVTSLTIQDLGTEKGMTAQRARLRLAYDTVDPDGPRSLIAKCSAADPQARAMIHAMGFYEREVCFYEQLAARIPLRTPRCYFSLIDPASGASLLLLEDLAHARNGSWVAGCSAAEADSAIRMLAAFHAAWWAHPDLGAMHWLALRGFSALEKVEEMWQATWGPCVNRLGAAGPSNIRQIGDWLERHAGRLSALLYAEPPCTIIHNDFQADNLFFGSAEDGHPLIVIDWQLVTRGRGVWDVAYFLGGNLDPDDRRQHELRLLHTYHRLLLEHGVQGYTFDQCLDEYRLAMLVAVFRLSAPLGFGAVPGEQEGDFCEVLIPRYCRAVHDLNVGDLLQAVP